MHFMHLQLILSFQLAQTLVFRAQERLLTPLSSELELLEVGNSSYLDINNDNHLLNLCKINKELY